MSNQEHLDEIYNRIESDNLEDTHTLTRASTLPSSLPSFICQTHGDTLASESSVPSTSLISKLVDYGRTLITKDTLKCSFAYFLASLAVYIEPVGRFLGKSDNKHLVATVAVYFHPSRTIGLMNQLICFIILSLAYSFSVSVICATLANHTKDAGQDELSYLINVLFILIALSALSVCKVKMKKQNFNVACSLAATSMILSIVKEGSRKTSQDPSHSVPFDRLVSVFRIVCFGSLISALLCYLIWPKSAQIKLKSSLNETYYLMSDYIVILTDTFLARHSQHESALADVQKRLKKLTGTLKAALEESRFELLAVGKEHEYDTLSRIVDSTMSLTRAIVGLKNASDLQWALVNENIGDRPANEITSLFLSHLGPPILAFSNTIRETLDHVPFSVEAPHAVVDVAPFESALLGALNMFSEKQSLSMSLVYSNEIFKRLSDDADLANEEEVAASCFNFCYSISEYASELQKALELFRQYKTDVESGHRSFRWTRDMIFGRRKYTPFVPQPLQRNRTQIILRPSTSGDRRYRIWKFFNNFRRSDMQFGIRVGTGAFVLSSLAFIPYTRDFFVRWRMEWALIIYSIMMNLTVGATQLTVKWRLLGTFLGSAAAVLAWSISSGSAVILACVGFLMSLPSFHIILKWTSLNAYGRFILLSYNLTALYSYSMTLNDEEDDEEGGNIPLVLQIGLHRFVSVSMGICWAIFITSFVLPASARLKLRAGLSLLWLQLGISWNSDPLGHIDEEHEGNQTALPLEKFHIHDVYSQLETYCSQAPMEFRIKGPFNFPAYRSLLDSSQSIINALENMNMVILKQKKSEGGSWFVVNFVRDEIEELESRILMNFYMIASAMKLRLPPPTKGVSTEHAKDKMLLKLARVRKFQKEGNYNVTDKDFTLMYLYVSVSSQIVKELANLNEGVRALFEKSSLEDIVL